MCSRELLGLSNFNSSFFGGIAYLLAETTIVKQYHIKEFYIKMNILRELAVISPQCHNAMTQWLAASHELLSTAGFIDIHT